MSRLLQTGLNVGKDPAIKVVDGEGVYFVLADGRRLIDGSNTGGPLGHKHPVMVEAMIKAASNPVINEGWFWAEREAAAARDPDAPDAGGATHDPEQSTLTR